MGLVLHTNSAEVACSNRGHMFKTCFTEIFPEILTNLLTRDS